MLLIESDAAFFRRHPTRQARIRHANRGEMDREFKSLGVFPDSWRRMLVWKVPGGIGAPFAHYAGKTIPIPFVLKPGEEYEDNDRVLMPLIEELMNEAAKEYGMTGKN